MTGLLLDTDALAWVLVDSPRLGTTARALLQSSPVWFSPLSVARLETARLQSQLPAPTDAAAACAATGARELPCRSSHVAGLAEVGDDITDDVDRLLLAQAAVEGLTVLTANPRLLARGDERVRDATV